MNEQEWSAMRGFVDIALGALIIGRTLHHSSQTAGFRARLAQLTVMTLLLAVLEMLGLWSLREIQAALKMLPVVWPLVVVILFLAYWALKYRSRIRRMQFEIDWRKEYQEVLMEQLERGGGSVPAPPTTGSGEDRKE